MALKFFVQVNNIHKSSRKAYYYERGGGTCDVKVYLEYDQNNSRYHAQVKATCGRSSWFHYALAFRLFDQTPNEIHPSVRSGYSDYNENCQYGGLQGSWGTLGLHAQNPTGSSNRVFSFTTDLYFNHAYVDNVTWSLSSQGGRGAGWIVNTAEGSQPPIPPPYRDTTISITSPDSNSLHRHDQNMTVKWSSWSTDGTTSQTWITINGNKVDANSGNSAGSYTFTPSNYGVKSGSSFTVIAYRKHSTGRNTASSSRTFRTYTQPTASNIKMDPNPVSANADTTISWDGNSAVHSGETINSYLSINEGSEINRGTNNSWTGTLGQYVPFTKDNQNVTIKVRRVNANSTGLTAETTFNAAKVLYTPTVAVKNLIFKKNTSTGTTINPGETIDKSEVTNIYTTWDVPTGSATGVISGYRIIIKSANEKTVTYYTSTNSYNVPVSDLTACQSHTVQVNAYYLENGNRHYGPSTTSNYVLPMSRLTTPQISYPANNSNWINRKFRVLFTLPSDPDYLSLPSDVRAGYIYKDVELQINGSVILSWTANPTTFSLETVSYMAKTVINPSLISSFPTSSNQYTLRMRVRKNYGDPNSSIAWSDWSPVVTVNVQTASFSVNQFDEIMASHYNNMRNVLLRMRNTYPLFTFKTIAVTAGQSKIQRSDYSNSYNDLTSIVNAINTWGEFASSRSAVKLPTLASFTPRIEEIKYNSPGNYIKVMYDLANSLV